MQFKFNGVPVPWKAHGGFGKRSFNPRGKERESYRKQIREQMHGLSPLSGPIALFIVYHLPIPKNTSKIRRRQMLDGTIFHLKRPDIDNLCKFCVDCLKTMAFEDDSQVVALFCQKEYAEHPCTVVHVAAAVNLVEYDCSIPIFKNAH